MGKLHFSNNYTEPEEYDMEMMGEYGEEGQMMAEDMYGMEGEGQYVDENGMPLDEQEDEGFGEEDVSLTVFKSL